MATTKNEKTQNPELENHDSVANARSEAVLLMKQSNQNEIKLGATCTVKKINEGSAIMDKTVTPNVQKIDLNTGEPMFYKDKYFITLTFDGGEVETEVTREQYDDVLQEGGRYLCNGRLSPVKNFGQTVIAPVFYAFTRLY